MNREENVEDAKAVPLWCGRRRWGWWAQPRGALRHRLQRPRPPARLCPAPTPARHVLGHAAWSPQGCSPRAGHPHVWRPGTHPASPATPTTPSPSVLAGGPVQPHLGLHFLLTPLPSVKVSRRPALPAHPPAASLSLSPRPSVPCARGSRPVCLPHAHADTERSCPTRRQTCLPGGPWGPAPGRRAAAALEDA